MRHNDEEQLPNEQSSSSWSMQHNSRYLHYFTLCALIVVHLGLCLKGVANFPTIDEIGHLPAGVSHWRFRRFDLYRVNPPLVRMVCTTAVRDGGQFDWFEYSARAGMRPEFDIGLKYLAEKRLAAVHAYILPRMVASMFSLLGLIAGYTWLKSLFPNSLAPLIFSTCWAFCPNVLANASTIGPDVGAMALGIVALYMYWAYSLRPSTNAATIAGISLGIALLTKLTWLTAVASLPVVTLVCLKVVRKSPSLPSHRAAFRDLLIATIVAILVVNIGYCFEGTLTKLGDYQFCSEAFGGEGASRFAPKSPFVESTALSFFPVPLPRNFILGIDYLKAEVEEKKWSFLLGEWKHGSWPHYYIMTTLFKTPEPTLLAAVIGFGVLVVGIWRKMVEPRVITAFLFLGVPAGVCVATVSLQGGFNHHHRYVLMIYPFVFALAAYTASPVGVKLLRFRLPFLGRTHRSIAVPLAVTLVILSAASSLRVHPYYTSYFNTLSGGPENGWRLLGSSNIDWGQDVLEVDKWIKQHPECRPLMFELDYYGMNGNLFGLANASPPDLPKNASIDKIRESITETQWWIISVKKLYNLPGQDGLEYVQQFEPVDRIAYAYYVYRVDPNLPQGNDRVQQFESNPHQRSFSAAFVDGPR